MLFQTCLQMVLLSQSPPVKGMPQIKSLADLVTTADCDHDGVAEVFETLGL